MMDALFLDLVEQVLRVCVFEHANTDFEKGNDFGQKFQPQSSCP